MYKLWDNCSWAQSDRNFFAHKLHDNQKVLAIEKMFKACNLILFSVSEKELLFLKWKE